MPDARVVVVGAGLAGLAAAATVREHGVEVVVHEAAAAPGGASVESAGWIWRYRDAAAAALGAPSSAPVVSQLVLDHLDRDLAWLVEHGVVPLASSTGRPDTVGVHVDPREVIDRLVDVVGRDSIVTSSRVASLDPASPVVLAAGGYAANFAQIAAECGAAPGVVDAWVRRPVSESRGDGVELGLGAGGTRSTADGQCLVRIAIEQQHLVRDLLSAVSELLVPDVTLLGRDGEPIRGSIGSWSNAEVLRSFQVEHGSGVLAIPARVLDQRVHSGSIRDVVARLAQETDAVERRSDGIVRIRVRAGITHTWCGLDIDRDARVTGADRPLFAAGCDASGSGLGGTASGLAQALVLGRRAGAAAARAARTGN